MRGERRWAAIALMLVIAVAVWYGLSREATLPAGAPSAAAQPQPADPGQAPASPEGAAEASLAASAVPAVSQDCPPEWRALAGLPASAVDARLSTLRQQALIGASSVLLASADGFERLVGQLLAESARPAEGEPDLEVLEAAVDAAKSTRDPRMAALAFQACHSADVAALKCGELGAAGWADIDGSNLHAWLTVAAEAKDRGAQNRALARAASGLEARTLWPEMQRLLAGPQLASLSSTDRALTAGELRVLSGQYGMAGVLELPLLCSSAELQSATRRSQCRRIAQGLIEGGGSITERGVGLSVARLTGWAPNRIDALERALAEEAQAAAAASMVPPVKNNDRLTLHEACEVHRAIAAALR